MQHEPRLDRSTGVEHCIAGHEARPLLNDARHASSSGHCHCDGEPGLWTDRQLHREGPEAAPAAAHQGLQTR